MLCAELSFSFASASLSSPTWTIQPWRMLWRTEAAVGDVALRPWPPARPLFWRRPPWRAARRVRSGPVLANAKAGAAASSCFAGSSFAGSGLVGAGDTGFAAAVATACLGGAEFTVTVLTLTGVIGALEPGAVMVAVASLIGGGGGKLGVEPAAASTALVADLNLVASSSRGATSAVLGSAFSATATRCRGSRPRRCGCRSGRACARRAPARGRPARPRRCARRRA